MIKIEPSKVESNADTIDSLGKQMQTQMETVYATVKSLNADWQDSVQVNWETDFTKLKRSFEELTEMIPTYTSEARGHAEQMRRIGRGN